MRGRAAGLAIGVVFGVVLCWSGMSNPDVIRGALLFEQPYLFEFFAAAVLTAAAGQWLLGYREGLRQRPERRHVLGALIFGAGWGIADACPGPIATQLGQGIAWSLLTMAGVVVGVYTFLRRERVESEPATEPPGAAGSRRLASVEV